MTLSCSRKIIVIIKRNNIKKIMLIFIVSTVFIPLEQKKLESYKKVCENKNLCNVIMPSEDTEIKRI